MQLVHKKGFINLIYSLFIFEMLFPSFRVLLIGHEGANTFIEYFIASLPEFFLAIIACYTFALLFKENIQMKWVITDKLVLFFILFNVIIGTYLAANLKISLYGFRMSYLPVFFYFLVRFSPIKKDDFLQLINKLFTLFSFVGLLGIIIYFFFFDFMVDMIHKTGSGVTEYFIPRMTSILWTPVVFGTFMSITFCYFYFKLFQKNASKLNYFLLSIASFCTFFSLSRGSIIIMFLGLFLIPILLKKWRKLIFVFFILLFQFLSLNFYINLSNVAQNNSSIGLNSHLNSSNNLTKWMVESYTETAKLKKGVTRIDLWKNAFTDFKKKPFGYGLGKSGHVATRFFSENPDVAAVSSTDGWFIKIINETGILGLLTYLTFLMFFLITTWKNFKEKTIPIIGFTLTMFILVNIQNLVSNVLDFYLFSNLFWLLLGITENIKSKE